MSFDLVGSVPAERRRGIDSTVAMRPGDLGCQSGQPPNLRYCGMPINPVVSLPDVWSRAVINPRTARRIRDVDETLISHGLTSQGTLRLLRRMLARDVSRAYRM
jgi:hypothetical protein